MNKINYKYTFIIYILLNSFFIFSCHSKDKELTIAGDACTVPLAQKLADAFTQKTGVKVNIQAAGCATGIYKAVLGEVDIGVSTHDVDKSSLPAGTTVKVIAKAPTILIVNKKNPINNLSISQVKDLISGKIENWKSLGGKDIKIKNVFLQTCTVDTFAKKTSPVGKNIERIYPKESNYGVEATNNLVTEYEEAIGLQIFGYQGDDVKILKIDGELPDESTFPRKYGYYQDYSIIIKGRPKGNSKAFLDFALSDEGQDIAASLKHIKIEEKVNSPG
ncbi:MAG: substrate-binding domain-containing protein [Spirochaetia bacterium]|nr:substrate-binding domain-containing protein [Spirochaetia bacterium]